MGQVEAHLVCLEIVLISAQDRCTDWDEHTIGLKIILGTPYGTPRCVGQMEPHFSLFGDSVNLDAR
jgi:hypothetical protein